MNTTKARSYNMSQIRSTDTSIEKFVRSNLHIRGYRFFKNYPLLQGKPDVVLKKYSVAIFVNGCFWHGHNCKYSSIPKTNTAFWINKIKSNCLRDKNNISKLLKDGWRVGIIWECAIRNTSAIKSNLLIINLEKWILSKSNFKEFTC